VLIFLIFGGDATLKLRDNQTRRTVNIGALDQRTERSNSKTFETTLSSSGDMTLRTRHYEKNWHFDVVADHAPTIKLTKEPGRILNGSLELNYALDDDYG